MCILGKNKILNFIIFVIIMSIFFILINCFSQEKILVVRDMDAKTEKEFLLLDKSFILGYTHSVLLTPAEEYFVIDDIDRLLLQKTVYESFGVGLPYSQEYDWEFEIKDGKFILYINREFKEINMVISSIPNHWLGIDGEKISLIDIIEKPEDKIKLFAKESLVFKLGNYSYTF